MRISTFPSYMYAEDVYVINISIGWKYWALGVSFEKYTHIRIMLIWWHVCITFKSFDK